MSSREAHLQTVAEETASPPRQQGGSRGILEKSTTEGFFNTAGGYEVLREDMPQGKPTGATRQPAEPDTPAEHHCLTTLHKIQA